LLLKGCISVCGKYVAIRNAREAESQPPDNDKTIFLGAPVGKCFLSNKSTV
jgi:hypothetical protein